MIALRTAANVWQVERRNQNAEGLLIAGRREVRYVGRLHGGYGFIGFPYEAGANILWRGYVQAVVGQR